MFPDLHLHLALTSAQVTPRCIHNQSLASVLCGAHSNHPAWSVHCLFQSLVPRRIQQLKIVSICRLKAKSISQLTAGLGLGVNALQLQTSTRAMQAAFEVDSLSTTRRYTTTFSTVQWLSCYKSQHHPLRLSNSGQSYNPQCKKSQHSTITTRPTMLAAAPRTLPDHTTCAFPWPWQEARDSYDEF